MARTTKLCIDCAHYDAGICYREGLVSPVTGKRIGMPAREERTWRPTPFTKCGEEGKFFTPKPADYFPLFFGLLWVFGIPALVALVVWLWP